MSEENAPKKWWQTLPALLTGMGTFLVGVGAVLGFFVGSQHAEKERREEPAAAASPSSTTSGGSVVPKAASITRPANERGSSSRATVRKASVVDPPNPPEPVLTRQPYFLDLPEQREYNMQADYDRAIYMLLRAKVIPQTPASDLLRITLRVISRNRRTRSVSVYQKWFELVTEDQKFQPEDFSERVPPMQTRDVDIEFYLPADLGHAKLKMGLWNAAPVEILLNITPKAAEEGQVAGDVGAVQAAGAGE